MLRYADIRQMLDIYRCRFDHRYGGEGGVVGGGTKIDSTKQAINQILATYTLCYTLLHLCE